MEEEKMVMIIGAGPAGIAVSACLNRLKISNMVLEKEDCCASLWKKRSYDRLKLHLAKEYCQLPYMPFPSDTPTFVPKNSFISYLTNYVSHFDVTPRYNRCVESAYFDVGIGKWRVLVKHFDDREVYVAKFLVIATGENSEGIIPRVDGLDTFGGNIMHSSEYENGEKFNGKNVLVVGCGNSGMEIAYDLSNWGANTSIVARNPVHVLTKEMVYVGLCLLKSFPFNTVDNFIIMLSKSYYGNISNYGLERPSQGPFYLKEMTGRSPTIDVGTMKKIKNREIKVFPSITSIKGNIVNFQNDEMKKFEAIIFATGYRSSVRKWLKGGEDLINENGMPNKLSPNTWKGEKGLYCAGFSGKGLFGISMEAQNIARDISIFL